MIVLWERERIILNSERGKKGWKVKRLEQDYRRRDIDKQVATFLKREEDRE